jgi:hypothetical protein
MTDTLIALGRTDAADEAALRDACDRTVELMEMCERHLEHENRFIHAALQLRCPGVCDAVAREHEDHLRVTQQLSDAARGMAAVPADQRAGAMHALYLALALFVADNLQHMHAEETRHNAALWAAYDDLELIALHDALVASIPPQEMMQAVNATERLGLLNDLQTKAPAPVFDAVLDLARLRLNQADFARLARGVNLPPVPGLVV